MGAAVRLPGEMTHVVVDARMARDGGIGTYLSNVLPLIIAARPQWSFTLLARPELRAEAWTQAANVTVRDARSRIYTVGEQLELMRLKPRGCDLLWSPHYNIPVFSRARQFVTIHDVAHLVLPEFTKSAAKSTYARAMFAAVRRKAAAIVCDSAFTLQEYRSHVGAGGAEPEVIHLGVDDAWRAADLGARPRVRPYIVHVGSVKSHKNLSALLDAFSIIQHRVPHDLIIVGRREGLKADGVAMERAAAMGARVIVTGEVPIGSVRAYVKHADLLVMPSLYEGFGLPPLEAMAAGTPCVVSSAASLPEVCGSAVMYCDPRDPWDIAAAMERVLCDAALRERLRGAGNAHVAAFTWARCAAATLDAMERSLAA